MKRLSLFVFLFYSSLVFAQKITITGTVVDQDTREPLVNATLSIKGKSIATITNQAGAFDFFLPQLYRNEILVISMVGYTNFESPVWSIVQDNSIVIEMTRSTTVLDEVIILEQYTGDDILAIAVSRIEKNYPMQPFMLDGFYRDIRKVAGTYIGLLEAAVKIYDQDYAAPRNKLRLRERVKLIEVRKSLGYDNKFAYYFDQVNFLEDLLLHNDIRYRLLNGQEEAHSKMKRLKDSFYNDREIYVLEYSGDYWQQLYVDKLTFAIVHIQYERGPELTILEKKRNLTSRSSGMKKTIDFRMVEDRLYPNYIQLESKVSWYDVNTNAFKFETELIQQLLINNVLPNTPERISSGEKMRNYSLQYQDRPYNKTFWDNYNVIKESPLDKRIIEDLEKGGPLTLQFERTNY